jgi:hypothetical protein
VKFKIKYGFCVLRPLASSSSRHAALSFDVTISHSPSIICLLPLARPCSTPCFCRYPLASVGTVPSPLQDVLSPGDTLPLPISSKYVTTLLLYASMKSKALGVSFSAAPSQLCGQAPLSWGPSGCCRHVHLSTSGARTFVHANSSYSQVQFFNISAKLSIHGEYGSRCSC